MALPRLSCSERPRTCQVCAIEALSQNGYGHAQPDAGAGRLPHGRLRKESDSPYSDLLKPICCAWRPTAPWVVCGVGGATRQRRLRHTAAQGAALQHQGPEPVSQFGHSLRLRGSRHGIPLLAATPQFLLDLGKLCAQLAGARRSGQLVIDPGGKSDNGEQLPHPHPTRHLR